MPISLKRPTMSRKYSTGCQGVSGGKQTRNARLAGKGGQVGDRVLGERGADDLAVVDEQEADHRAAAHWARARSWRPLRSADEVRVPATTNAVSSGSRPRATGSDAHSDRRPMTGGPQTNPAHPQADAVATAVPGCQAGYPPSGTEHRRNYGSQANAEAAEPEEGSRRLGDEQGRGESGRRDHGQRGQQPVGPEAGEQPVAGQPDGDHGQRERGVAEAGDHAGGVQRAGQVDRGPVGGSALAQHRGEGDRAEQDHPAGPARGVPTRPLDGIAVPFGRGVGAAGLFRGGRQHPRREQPGGEQGDRAQDKQLDAEGDAGARRPARRCRRRRTSRCSSCRAVRTSAPAAPVRSTAMAWVFMATSRVPWNAPQTNSAANSAGRLPVSPTSGPAAQ